MTILLTIILCAVVFAFLYQEKVKKISRNLSSAAVIQNEKMEKLQDSYDQLRSIIDNMNEAIVVITPKTKIIFYNKCFEQLFSSRYKITDKTLFSEVVRNAQLTELIEHSLKQKDAMKKVVELEVKDRRTVHQVQAVYMKLDKGDLIAIVFHDLTEIKEAEKMKRDFITNASHQLKTPLTAIQGYAETLIEDDDIDLKTRRDFLKKIENKSVEAADLVVKLLKLSKLESKAEDVHLVTVDVVKTIRDLEKKFEGNLHKYQIELIHEFNSDVTEIVTDPSLFQLILENLLENAIKYSKPKGRVFISGTANPHHLMLKIRDEGIGIPKDDQARIFERFFRSSNAESHSHDGIGIGMALVKSALDRVGGSVSVASHQNEGTSMLLTFPRSMQA